ncbi:MAG TPA: helix-turn-helix domain-containing protein [Ignavibacteriaceae bacterium]|nr:helix-turn-helix domain-containing protein [Ignavibacteriaceae bacterium]
MKQELYLILRDDLEQILSEIIRKEMSSVLQAQSRSNTEDEDFISFNETLRLLKISRPTLFKHMKNGIVPYRKIGRRLLFPKQVILKSLESKK